MEPDETKQPETQPELPPSAGDGQDAGEPLEGHPIEEFKDPLLAGLEAAHAHVKAKIEAFERRGIHPVIDDLRVAFKAIDDVLEAAK